MNVRLVVNRGQREELKNLLEETETTIGDPPGHVPLTFNALAVSVQEEKAS